MASSTRHPAAEPNHAVHLAIDTGSPVTSVALAHGSELLAQATSSVPHSSEALLTLIRKVLHDAGLSAAELDGVVVLRGPGSFTGLRIGLATAFGLHQATGIPAVAIGTLEVLAEAAEAPTAIAVVDALRGEWIAQRFERGNSFMQAVDGARRMLASELSDLRPDVLIGFGCSRIAADWHGPSPPRFCEPKELSSFALRRIARVPPGWDPKTLTEPIYYRPAAARKLVT